MKALILISSLFYTLVAVAESNVPGKFDCTVSSPDDGSKKQFLIETVAKDDNYGRFQFKKINFTVSRDDSGLVTLEAVFGGKGNDDIGVQVMGDGIALMRLGLNEPTIKPGVEIAASCLAK